MGTGVAKQATPITPEDKAAIERNRQIEKELAKSYQTETKTIKLLLLGGAESGKSTFAKQMKILHLNGFNDEELNHFRLLVHSNIILAIHQLLFAITDLKIDIDSVSQHDIAYFNKFAGESKTGNLEMSLDIVSTIKRMWHSRPFSECYKRKMEFDILDSAKYFLDDIDRVTDAQYKPNSQDILRARAVTLGIHEIEFHYKEFIFRMVDVGGQKTERRKWIHCFENVTAILFITAISEYDQFLAEDREMNRMHDSLALFKSISYNKFLSKSSILLFLNKKDIFIEKIERSPLKACFPDYTGNNTYEEASEYILKQYLKRVPPSKTVYHHFTNATDTKNVEVVFAASMNTILNKALSTIGMT